MAKRSIPKPVIENNEAPGTGPLPRSDEGRAIAWLVGASSSSTVMPPKPTKCRSKRARSIEKSPGTDPSKRTIGERITALRGEAEILALYLQEPDDGFEGDDEDREADSENALGLMEVLKCVDDPSPAVAALVVRYRPRPDWPPLDRAKDVRDELELIGEVFEASGFEDEGFESCLEELYGWMYEF